jgi:hypothetical protein
MVGLWVPLAACCLLTPLPGPTAAAASIEEGADAIILEERMEIEIHSVTNATVRYTNRTKVLTARGVAKHDVASVYYSTGVRVRDLRGSVTYPSGRTVKIKKKRIFDGAAFASFQLYSDSRHRSISFPGVVPGAIVEHSYELAIKNLIRLPWGFSLQETIPVRLKALTIKAPSSFSLRLSVRGGSPEYVREERNGVITQRWNVRDVPALRLDRSTPPSADLLPKILIAPKRIRWGDYDIDAATWDGIARFYWQLSRDRMEPTTDVARKANDLTAGVQDPLEKTRLLYEFVQGKVNYVSISLDIGGYQPHGNGEVLRHLYGDCKDKATLTIAMLRSVGLKGFPVLILKRDAGLIDRDNPALSFNHAILAVPSEEGYLFMDPTSEETPFGDLPWEDQGVPVLVIKEDGQGDLVETPLFSAEHNRRHITLTGRIGTDDAMEGYVVIEAWGQRLGT